MAQSREDLTGIEELLAYLAARHPRWNKSTVLFTAAEAVGVTKAGLKGMVADGGCSRMAHTAAKSYISSEKLKTENKRLEAALTKMRSIINKTLPEDDEEPEA